MTKSFSNIIMQFIQHAEGHYHRLILLVGDSGSGKTGVLREVATQLDTSVININLTLSLALLELTDRQRTLRLPTLLATIVHNNQYLALLDNTEILFDPNLKQDPLRLLQGISRNQTVVASWNGKIEAGKLIYAEAGHPEYKRYDLDDIIFVDMHKTATTTLT